jgi:hypothetical protein
MEDPEKRGSKKHFYVVHPKSQEGTLAVTWFRRKWEGSKFFMGFQDAFTEIAQKRLGSEAKDVFLFILGKIDFHNEVITPQVEIARKLGMKKQNVSRAIKVLVKEKILEEILLDGEPLYKQKRRLRLNHKYAWKGKLKNLGLKPIKADGEGRRK